LVQDSGIRLLQMWLFVIFHKAESVSSNPYAFF